MAPAMPSSGALVFALAVLVFIIDLVVPRGFAVWLLYLLPLMFLGSTASVRLLLMLTGLISILLVMGYFFGPTVALARSMFLANRTAALGAVWIITLVLVGRNRAYKRMVESGQFSDAVIDAMNEGCVVLAPDGKVLRANAAARQMGEGSAQMEADHLQQLYGQWEVFDMQGHALEPPQWPFSRALARERFKQEVVQGVRRADGVRAYLSFSGAPVYDSAGRFRFALLTFRDVGREVEAEAVLRQARTLSEQRAGQVERLNAELAQRAQQLLNKNAELETFAYSVSHDLRTPLQIVTSFASALLEVYGGRLDEEGRDWLKRIEGGVRRMDVLIQDILTLSSISREELRPQCFDLALVAAQIVAQLREAQPKRQVDVVIQGPMEVCADGRLVRIALENLLGNAWKFTSHRSRGHIEIGMQEHPRRVYYVRDNGAGFDMQFVNRLFIPFERLHAGSEFSGTGVGLATVKRVVELHGGEVWAEGVPKQGATFFFTLGRVEARDEKWGGAQ